jgi:O-antigen ligase
MGKADNLVRSPLPFVCIARGLLAGMLLLTPVIFWRGGLEPFELCKVALVQLTALGLLVTAGMAASSGCAGLNWHSLRKRLVHLAGDPVSAAMLLGALSATLSTVTSLSPRTSWHGRYENGMGLMTTLAMLVVYFATRIVCPDARSAWPLLGAVAIALVPPMLYALFQMAGLDPFAWEQTSTFAQWTRPGSTLGHPNYLAGYAVMALPLVIGLAWQSARTQRRRTALVLALLSALACAVALASLSRSAWLVLFLGAVAGFIRIVARLAATRSGALRCASRLNRAPKLWMVAALLTLLVTLTVITVTAGVFRPFVKRVSQMTVLGGRGPIWLGAWRIFVDHPWTGCGLETFDLAFRRYGTAAFWRFEGGLIPSRAHNDVLHTLATQGMPGLIAFLLLLGSLVWASRRAWQRNGCAQRGLVLALASAILAWYILNCFSFPVAPTASLFVVLAALLSRLAWPGVAEETLPWQHAPLRWLVSCLLLGCGVTMAYLLVARPYLAGCASQLGERVQKIQPYRALHFHERAVRLDPGRDVLWLRLGACTAIAAESCPDASQRQTLLLRGRAAVEEACRLVSVSSENHANRGRVLRALAREGWVPPDEVLAAFDMALALDPENTVYLADAAAAAVSMGLTGRARQYIERGLRIDADLGMLHTDLAALELAQRHYAEAERHLNAAVAGRWHESKQYPRALSLLCLTYLETGRNERALQVADHVLTREDSLPVRFLRARALERLGRRAQAAEEYRRIVQVRPDHALAQAGLTRLHEVPKNGKCRQDTPAGSGD